MTICGSRSVGSPGFAVFVAIAAMLSVTACDDSNGESGNPDADVGEVSDADTHADADFEVEIDVEECPDYGALTDDVFLGYLSSLSLTGPDCCFTNLDGDAAIDNDLTALVDSLSTIFEQISSPLDLDWLVNGVLQQSIDQGAVSVLMRATNVYERAFESLGFGSESCPELRRAKFDFVSAERFRTTEESCTNLTVSDDCFDADAGQCTDDAVCVYPVSSDADVQAGAGSFEILESLLGADKADLLEGVFVDGRFLLARGPEPLNLPIDLGRAFPGQVEAYGLPSELILPVYKLRVRSTIAESTSDSAPDSQRGFSTTATGELGGAIALESVLEILNPYFDTCFEADVPQVFAIDAESNADRLVLTCDENLIVDNPAAIGGLCKLFTVPDGSVDGTTSCGLFDTIIAANLSVDTDEDGKADALAFGLNFELVGAALATESAE